MRLLPPPDEVRGFVKTLKIENRSQLWGKACFTRHCTTHNPFVLRASLACPPLGQFPTALLISFQDVLVKAPDAIIEIPELEFEFGASKRRQVDSIYNFLAGAVFNLSNHVKDSAAMQSDTKNKIMETVDEVDWPPCVSNVIDIV